MARIITICNNKGGVGKTTSIGTISMILASLNKKILIVDGDPQGNSSQLFGAYRKTNKTIIDIYLTPSIQKFEVEASIFQTEYENISIIPSNEDFTFTCDDIAKDNTRIQQYILKKALAYIQDDYDFIFIDNSPFFTILTINALCAAQDVLIPVEANGYSYQGLKQLLSRITSIMELNESLSIKKIYINKANSSTILLQQLYRQYLEELGDTFSSVIIRQDNNINESSTAFIPLTKYNKTCNAVKDYKKLVLSLNILDPISQDKLKTEVEDIYMKEIQDYKKKLNGKENSKNFSTQTLLFNLEVAEKNKDKIAHMYTKLN